ncbi:MAG: uracil-DNA glycosylase [Acidimicrobiales bacterium]
MTDAQAPCGPDAALREIGGRVARCVACPRLVAWREEAASRPPPAFRGEEYWQKGLPGVGVGGARLVVVGLAPAAHGGNRTGRMFTGDRSGDFLFAALWRAGFANQAESVRRGDGLELTDCYVTAAVRCAPPDNKPLPPERDRCRHYLEEELAVLDQARVYLALGAFAYDALLRTSPVAGAIARPKRRFAHGLEIELDLPEKSHRRWLVCTYHPSQRNVFTGLLSAAMFDDVLRRARSLLRQS